MSLRFAYAVAQPYLFPLFGLVFEHPFDRRVLDPVLVSDRGVGAMELSMQSSSHLSTSCLARSLLRFISIPAYALACSASAVWFRF